MNIAFFGLGNMGFPIAQNLLRVGHSVTIAVHRDPVPARKLAALDAVVASSASEAVRGAELIFSIVPNDQSLKTLLLDESMLAAVPEGSVIVEMTSSSAEAVQAVATAYARKGVSLLDAPVSGGVAGAANATMSMLCAGDPAIYERVLPVLKQISKTQCYVGAQPGQGKVVKSLNNLLSAINKAAVGEAWQMARANGVDSAAFFDAISASSGDSAALRAAFPHIRDGNYAAGFTVALMRKDLEIAMALTDGQTLPLAETVLEYYRRAAPFDQEDSSAVAKVRFGQKGFHV